ncbi:MAG: SLC13 family permease [Candidatus Promineifilaceae bacterium]|jgi:di/tricarboxylate transporter
MTTDIAITLLIILAALVLFATEKLRVDVVALLVLITVGIFGLIPPDELFSGFSNSAVITVWAVYMVSGGLFKTGVADSMGRAILKVAGDGEVRLIATIMLTVGLISAFMNNVGAVAMLLPAVVGISRQTKTPISKLLIPLAFASLLGGKMTLIGTPANILAAGILTEVGLESFGFFEFTPMGIVVLATGILYMITIGRRLLPVREGARGRQDFDQLRGYVTEVRVNAGSPLAGKTLVESCLGKEYDFTVLAMQRENGDLPPLHRDTRIRAGDMLALEGQAANILAARRKLGLTPVVVQDVQLDDLEPHDIELVEVALAPNSRLIGHSLSEMQFRERFGFSALAISRQGEMIRQRVGSIPLRAGDMLLLQGSHYRIEELQQGRDFLVMVPVKHETFRLNKAPIAVGALLLAIGLTIFAGMDIALAMVIAAMIMILSGVLTIEEAYDSVDWRTVFLVAGMLPLGMAMAETGTAEYLADIVLGIFGPFGPRAALAGIYLLAALITQPMSNAAAIVLVVPIALDTAFGLGANYKTFTMAVVIGAATSFLSPVGHKANVLIFGPGGYKFTDYARVGALLTMILLIVSMIFLPIFWPLFP